MGAYSTMVRVEVEEATTGPSSDVLVWVTVTTFGNVTTAESMILEPSQ